MSEEWRPAPGYEGRYEISDQGRVRSLLRGAPRLLTPSTDSNGYQSVALWKDGARRWRRIHQMVVAAFVGPYPLDKPQVRHLDGDKFNNRLANLRYGTSAENAADAVRHGQHYEAASTHCKRGHVIDGQAKRQRYCKTCMNAHVRAYRAKRRAA